MGGRHRSVCVAVSLKCRAAHSAHHTLIVIGRLEYLPQQWRPQVTPATKPPPLEPPADKRLTPMSPPIQLFLTTIVSSPALRQRQGNGVHNASTPNADDAYDLNFC
jgi:hypothetical protein